MKIMNSRALLALIAAPGFAFLSACNKADVSDALGAVEVIGPEYSANKGLFVPEITRRSLGLKIVDATEEKLDASVEFSLRVFEVRGERVRASGMITPQMAGLLKVGQSAQIRQSGGPAVAGTVVSLSDQLHKATGSWEAVVEFAKSATEVVDTFVTVQAATGSGQAVTTVPESAVIKSTEGTFVYTVSGEHFVRTPVKLGAAAAKRVEIKDGLYSGDQVVSEAAMSLWLTELAAIKGGHACCAVPAKGK